MIKTTRIKTIQAPKLEVYDLSAQLDGVNQTFTLPKVVTAQQGHYLIFNSTVYRNDAGHTYYTLSADGTKITTTFDTAPVPGSNRNLQLVVDDNDSVDSYSELRSLINALDARVSALEGNS